MTAPFSLGQIQLAVVSGGRMRIDGGNMFGVVPRRLWEHVSPPDDLNRIQLDTNCVVVRTPTSLGLIDTGYGDKMPYKYRRRHALDGEAPLVRGLAAINLTPEEFDWVLLTHLHFDHAGGATRRDEAGRLRPTFPRARHIVQRAEWEDATSDLPELAGAYYPDDFAPLEECRLLELVEGDVEITPEVSTRLTGGHTRGHQIVCIESSDASAVCLADICPTAAHLHTFWTLSYDQFPLEVRRSKPAILSDIADRDQIALFSHDPDVTSAHLHRKSKGEWSATPIRA